MISRFQPGETAGFTVGDRILTLSREVLDVNVHVDEDLDDARLVAQTRAGDRDAFGVLWRRHAHVAGGVARSFTSSADPDDLVAESFARVYLAIRNGGGPNESFRPYLLTTLRNTARTWGSRSHETATDTIEDYIDDTDPDPILMGLANRELIQRTFSSLPTRWQEALWWSEVEGRSTAEIAKLSGLSDNAAAALCYRAREGLRQAWIQTQVPTESVDPDCRWTLARIGAFVRSGLRSNQSERVQGHLDGCRRCAGIAVRAARIGSSLGIALVGVSSAGVAMAAVLGAGAGAGGVAVAPTGFAKLKNLTVSNPTVGIAAAAVLALMLAIPAFAVAGAFGAGPSQATDTGAVASLTQPQPAPTAAVSVPPRPQVDPKPKPSASPEPENVTVEPVIPTATNEAATSNSTIRSSSKSGSKSSSPASAEPSAPVESVPAQPSAPVETVPAPTPSAPVETVLPEPSPTASVPTGSASPSAVDPEPSPTEPSTTPSVSPSVTPEPEPTVDPSPTVTPPPSTPEPDPGDGNGGGSNCDSPGHGWWGCGGWGDRNKDNPDNPPAPETPPAKEPDVVDGN